MTTETQQAVAPAAEVEVNPTVSAEATPATQEATPTAAPAADTATTQETPPADAAADAEGPAEFVTYGHPAADAAVEMIREAGVTPEQATAWFKEAAATQDLSKIDYAAMEAALGKSKAAVVQSAVKEFLGETIATRNEAVDAAYNAVGGKEAFETARDYAKNSKDPAVQKQLAVLLPMFELGPGAAAIAARELKTLYEAGPNNSALSNSVTHGDSLDNSGGETIGKRDYYEQITAAHKKGDKQEIQRLNNLRQYSIKQGVQ